MSSSTIKVEGFHQQSTISATTTAPPPVPKIANSVDDRVEPNKGFQKAVECSITANGILYSTYGGEIELNVWVDLIEELKRSASTGGVKFTYMPVFIKAASMALQQFPILNSCVDQNCENIVYKVSHNIAVAMDSPLGITVPNIKNVQNLTVLEVAEELNRLMLASASGKLSTEDLNEPTFSLSNIGVAFARYDNQVNKSHFMQVSWPSHHPGIDVAIMTRFLNLWKSYLETPYFMILNMK